MLDRLSPQLFFRMLHLGREIQRRKNFRNYYELSRVGLLPLMKAEDRNEIMTYYWEGSLNEAERLARDRVIAQAKKDAEKTWAPSSAALDFLRRR